MTKQEKEDALSDKNKEESLIANMPKTHHIIIAPHADDEIIGCHEILSDKSKSIIILYTDTAMSEERRKETMKVKELYPSVKAQMFLQTVPTHLMLKGNTFYFPDPVYEVHPSHRLQGIAGEQLMRAGFNVIFYCTNMQAPYCHEVAEPSKKEAMLDECYPCQADLWRFEKKYILFEGRCKWLLDE